MPSPGAVSDASPLACLRFRRGASAKAKQAKAKPIPKAKTNGAAKPKATSPGQTKRAADGMAPKQAEPKAEAEEHHLQAIGSIAQVRGRFKPEKVDKALLFEFLAKCNRATLHCTNAKHMNLSKATGLECVSKDGKCIRDSGVVAAKKTASAKDFDEVFKTCSGRGLGIPDGYPGKMVERRFKDMQGNGKSEDGINGLVGAIGNSITPDEACDVLHALVVSRAPETKPTKVPRSEVGRENSNLHCAPTSALENLLSQPNAALPWHSALSKAHGQLSNLEVLFACPCGKLGRLLRHRTCQILQKSSWPPKLRSHRCAKTGLCTGPSVCSTQVAGAQHR